MRFFNTAGPVRCEEHYCIPPLKRWDMEEILTLIDRKQYFVLHAPRQTGKTSCLLALADYLNREGKYKCLYVNVEMAQAARENINEGIRIILGEAASRAGFFFKDTLLEEICHNVLKERAEAGALNEALTRWSEKSSKPSVILIDEIDSLVGDTLISVLRQLRAGYDKRPGQFPQSIILCGVRDVRDYRIHSDKDKAVITGGSAFNIRTESLRMGDFLPGEISELYLQHTEDTGQKFEDGVFELVREYSEGQPWLVNALGYEASFRMKESRDRHKPVTREIMAQAKENLILRMDTHLDQLADKLREERVRRVILPILTGTSYPADVPDDDLSYVRDLGLIKIDGNIRIANRIYQEVIPRSLIYGTQVTISHESLWYVRKDGFLDMNLLISAFQEFFREHSQSWEERFHYREAGPQLLMQAFLQRIVNSGGRVEREYGLGRKRTDLFVIWRNGKDIQKIVIELKIRRSQALESIIKEGIIQTREYMDRCGTSEGHLIIFDRDEGKTWDEKIFQREEIFQGVKITIWGM